MEHLSMFGIRVLRYMARSMVDDCVSDQCKVHIDLPLYNEKLGNHFPAVSGST